MRTINFSADDLLGKMEQYKLFRILLGGMYVKVDDVWNPCKVMMLHTDGTRFLSCGDHGFHETYNGIQALENHI